MIEDGLDGMVIHTIEPWGDPIGKRLLVFVNGPKHGETHQCDLRNNTDGCDPEPHTLAALSHDDKPVAYRLSSVIEVFGVKVQLAVFQEDDKP